MGEHGVLPINFLCVGDMFSVLFLVTFLNRCRADILCQQLKFLMTCEGYFYEHIWAGSGEGDNFSKEVKPSSGVYEPERVLKKNSGAQSNMFVAPVGGRFRSGLSGNRNMRVNRPEDPDISAQWSV